MHKLRRPGNLLLLALLAGAVVASIWLADGRPWAGGPAPLLNFLGRLAGVVGFVMMLIAAAVSIRIPGFDQPFGGLTELWKTHHVLGAGAFLLLLLHPVLMALANLPVSPQAPARLLIPTSIENWLGWGALIAMMVFLAPTFHFFGRPHYQIWKGIHSISALALILGAAHTLMWARTLPAWLWSAVTAVALGALAFRLVYRKLHPGRRFTIKKVVPLADRVVEVSMVPENGPPMTYMPGQFLYIAPLDPALKSGHGEEHPYTISSAPNEPVVRTTIKALGDATWALQNVTPDTPAWVDGPYGRFFEPGVEGPELWIGGGIGITPFMSRARAIPSSEPHKDIHLIYCANNPNRAYYMDELEEIAAQHDALSISVQYYEEEGPLTREWVEGRVPDLAARHVYVCGPDVLTNIVRRFCKKAGVPANQIHTESFQFL